jgi:hypothetical protein
MNFRVTRRVSPYSSRSCLCMRKEARSRSAGAAPSERSARTSSVRFWMAVSLRAGRRTVSFSESAHPIEACGLLRLGGLHGGRDGLFELLGFRMVQAQNLLRHRADGALPAKAPFRRWGSRAMSSCLWGKTLREPVTLGERGTTNWAAPSRGFRPWPFAHGTKRGTAGSLTWAPSRLP